MRGLEGLDCSPRGDVSGFVRVHDEKTPTMLDRRGSRRTEGLWLRTTVFAKDGLPVAKMLLNLASLKDSTRRMLKSTISFMPKALE